LLTSPSALARDRGPQNLRGETILNGLINLLVSLRLLNASAEASADPHGAELKFHF
jgi:hypothetical protein